MSATMEKFKTNRFLTVALAPRKRRRALLKDGKPVTKTRGKRKGC